MKENLQNIIKQNGLISIATFMSEALAHPKYGYYKKKDPFGRTGDFTTAPEISQIFGELIGVYCASIWIAMDKPSNIQIVEIGPGRGTLMKDFLRGTKNIEGFHDNLVVSMVETSPVLRDIQKQNLKEYGDKIKWFDNISQIEDKTSFFVANELFDALPIHQYCKKDGVWFERMVGLNEKGEFDFFLSKTANAALESQYPKLQDSSFVEYCPLGISLIKHISSHIQNYGGCATIIDYGYLDDGDNYKYVNSLQALKHHKYHPALEDVGDVDLTAHVNFSALQKSIDIDSIIMTQRDFLLQMDIEARKDQLLKFASDAQGQEIISSVKRLIGKEDMGDLFKVLTFNIIPN